MAGEWVEKSLGDLIDIKHGFAFSGKFFRDAPPGDVLLTGTPSAVGAASTPPRRLRDGDMVEVEIERVGRLRNYVRKAGSKPRMQN